MYCAEQAPLGALLSEPRRLWLGKMLRMVPEGLRRITRYHTQPL